MFAIRLFIIITILVLYRGEARAATQSVTAHITFAEKLSIEDVTSAEFGVLLAGASGTYTLSPQGEVTASGGGSVLGGTPKAATMKITGSQTQAIAISAANYVADKGVTPSAATCSYSGGDAGLCNLSGQAAPGTGKELLLGLTIAVDGTQVANMVAAPTFEVVVNYQ